MRKKKNSYPKPILKKLAQEIAAMINTNQGRFTLLERLEFMPWEDKNEIIAGMSSFIQQEMVDFFYLIKKEYEYEYETICDKALEKYRMAGLDTTPPEYLQGTFYKAYASKSRHMGRISLDVAWSTGGSALHVECFYLTYNPDGIHSFILVDDIPVYAYEDERQDQQPDLAEVDFEEACCLIYQAYANNLRYMTAPALGKFLYQKYIDYYLFNNTLADYTSLIRRISASMTPRQLVNSYFHGIRNRDYIYLESLTDNDSVNLHMILDNVGSFLSKDTLLLEAQAQELQAMGNEVIVTANVYTARDKEIYGNQMQFSLSRDEGNDWYIDGFELLKEESLGWEEGSNPFTEKVTCRVYYILEVETLFDMLDGIDNVVSIEERTYGIHLRIREEAEEFNQGVVFFDGVAADIVINNGEELAIISQDAEYIEELHEMFTEEYGSTVILLGTYESDLLTAHKYINGQYRSFEDVMYDHAAGTAFDDGMRCLSVSYTVKDRARVSELLEGIKDIGIDISQDQQIYYQFEPQPAGPGYFAEFALGGDWLGISTFGEKDMAIARNIFEERADSCVEFDGVEKRWGSIFDILNTGVKKEHPELEIALKEMYLNKWYYSGLSQLKGMSPSEASQTEEGSRLLWSMLKRFRQKEKNSSRHRLSLHEYIRKLEEKRQEKQ